MNEFQNFDNEEFEHEFDEVDAIFEEIEGELEGEFEGSVYSLRVNLCKDSILKGTIHCTIINTEMNQFVDASINDNVETTSNLIGNMSRESQVCRCATSCLYTRPGAASRS